MSDATSTPPLSSSSQGARLDELPRTSSSDDETCLFLTNLQDAATAENASEVDRRRLARQKRKRTSPEDQATLEAEYKRNPKPDKAARMEIVKHVALGEKEVQIWFQNRRQNTRRKSRPLLPHEIAAFGLGGLTPLLPDSVSCSTQSEEEHNQVSDNNVLGNRDSPDFSPAGASLIMPLKGNSLMTTPPKPLGDNQSSTQSSTFSISQGASQSSVLGYLSNRRNTASCSFSTPTSFIGPGVITPSSSVSSAIPSSCPERLATGGEYAPTSSQIRLSMSLDGKAELVPTDLSPQKDPLELTVVDTSIPHRRAGSLQRSQSALPFGPLSRRSSFSTLFIPRMPAGRSRDARTWEFCCDADARDELTTQAENESSGSAVAAISLLRSTSGALKSNINKRNSPVPKPENTRGKKPKLCRASSSLARMQNSKDHHSKTARKEKGSLLMKRSPSGDSDKENRVPDGSNVSTQFRRPLPVGPIQQQNRGRILELSKSTSTAFTSDGMKSKQKFSGSQIFEDVDKKEVDAEVEKFMRGEVSPSKKGDLDCIQGLLSLSQGNWR